MSRKWVFGVFLWAAGLALLPVLCGAQAMRARHVFIISFDGGKPAVMQQSAMPTLFAMRKQGAGTWSASTILPSSTLPSHTSMLTGVDPKKHHVLWNDYIPSKGLVTVPTVFQEAKKRGLTTAMFVNKEKFKHLLLPGTVDQFSWPGFVARQSAAAAATYIVAKRPNLCFIHLTDSDTAGHKYGWGSAEQIKSFADEDAALTVIRQAIEKAGIAGDSVVILTADHGGHGRTHGSSRPEDVHIPWIVWGKGVRRDFAITANVRTYDSAATALWLLGVPIPANWDGKPVTSAFVQ